MKRILALAMAAMLLLSGCGGKDNQDGDTKQTEAPAAAGITLKGATLTIGGELTATMMDKLGEPNEQTESPNCVYDGTVYDYIYDGFTLQVSRLEDKDTLLMVTVTDPAYTTDKGVNIGDTADAVIETYGDAEVSTKHYLGYTVDGYELTFNLNGGVVENIEYTAVE